MAVRGERELRELTNGDALELLGTVRFGRVVFARHALPTIRPVNHMIEDDQVIIYANLSIVPLHSDRQVVSYEADTIDHHTQLGWCVILTGTAEAVRDPDEVARYERLIDPWLPGVRRRVVRIRPDIVTGIELVEKVEVDQA
ncbi:pyridoxamine 5'-phosphate oxidase family protein [Nocardia sp. CDC159]|uniref:Pyridoxamine 5'-phosphate oxidase family protein n=1 Tax=Nocardia pulmonis TaxID=2951408 RepID=A0A9X2ECY6_9NOCA|nr:MULTISPECIES: pyridoxamine 5'-phosphate oxidase family protein [Nocardia]MCM6775771.1 pyridoxamine 5'-phosphate oxidase family protein [Nocardia pulmonis]MCM6788253.1 pyridoxamine 5'-phosphate oxidase family protein [Nocardia sp. CDC159]